ncbi:MAG: DEAD/DEAH box helicase, partial [Deltaproteobacteria bacterium]|nr:DEAD/DEAH box helicase [Deltaproteobacteria bacterium]
MTDTTADADSAAAALPPLVGRLQALTSVDGDALLSAFGDDVGRRQLQLYPAQEEAILELMSGKHVILNTPTGSGKTLVALALIFKAFAEKKRAVYTCPIKALV